MLQSTLPVNSNQGLIGPQHIKQAALLRLSDAFLVIACLLASSFLYAIPWHSLYSFAGAAAVATFYLLAEIKGVYLTSRIVTILRDLKDLWIIWSFVVLILLLIVFAFKDLEDFSREAILTWFAMTPAAISLSRILWRLGWRERYKHGHNTKTAAIVGLTGIGKHLERNIKIATWLGVEVKGYYEDRHTKDNRVELSNFQSPILGNTETLVQQARRGEINMIYITLPLRAEKRVNELLQRLSDTTASVYFVPDFNVFEMLYPHWYTLGDVPVVSIHETPFYGIDDWVKRAEDIILSSVILTLIAVPMLIIGIAIKSSSSGPALFKQRRYGIDGKEIKVWKFRTMTVCEDGDSVEQTKRNDPRVTPLGKFLRRTSLDELPQFINVLQGTMSIVGPRPHAVSHNEEYRKLIDRYMLRHKVKPGITGWAQVNGWRGEIDTLEKMEKRVEHDLDYIRSWSLLLDMRIIWLTLFKGFINKNSY